MIRLHIANDLAAGATLTLDEGQSRYLAAVMRAAVGDEVALFNGRDGEWRAAVVAVGKKSVTLSVDVRTQPQHVGPDLDLVIALVKRTRLEIIVEKAAELGARRVRPVITERTNADHTRVERLQAIAVEASEQTGRLDVPQVLEPVRLERMLADWDAGRRLLFCDEAGDGMPVLDALRATPEKSPLPLAGRGLGEGVSAPSLEFRTPTPDPSPQGGGEKTHPNRPWAILIGPEGGFSPREREQLRALPYATPATLGPRILRADTAAISALTLWQAAAGDWR